MGALAGATVLVAGAGLAGLAAARDLARLRRRCHRHRRARPRRRTGLDHPRRLRRGTARGGRRRHDRRGTTRNPGLCKDLGLKLTRILRSGFGYVRADASGKPRIVSRDASRGWERLARRSATTSGRTGSPSSDGTRQSPPTSPADPSRSGWTTRAPTRSSARRHSGCADSFWPTLKSWRSSRWSISSPPAATDRCRRRCTASTAATIAWRRRWPHRSAIDSI